MPETEAEKIARLEREVADGFGVASFFLVVATIRALKESGLSADLLRHHAEIALAFVQEMHREGALPHATMSSCERQMAEALNAIGGSSAPPPGTPVQ